MNPVKLYNRGVNLINAGMYAAALDVFERVLKVKPGLFEAAYNKGCCLQYMERYGEAVDAYRKALLIKPKSLDAINNLGVCLSKVNKSDEALTLYERGLQGSPTNHGLKYNSANALLRLNRAEEALAIYMEALEVDPNHVPSLYNTGNALRSLLRYEESVNYYKRALELQPDYVDAQWNLGLSYLVLGDLERGLALYEKGIIGVEGRTPHRIRPVYYEHIPLWEGQSLEDKTILIYPEQGLGDVIQYVRYAFDVMKLAKGVRLAVPGALRGLMSQFETGNCKVLTVGEEYQEVDYQCSLVSLPFVLKVKFVEVIPPYLKADPRKVVAWKRFMDPRTIGLAWSGNPAHPNDARRSMQLNQLAPIYARFPCVSMQKEVRPIDLPTLNSSSVRDVKEHLLDFTDTAALMHALRLVVTVDTSVAHLAGALGIPVWMMIPYEPDWRWFLDRQDSPWYPSMRIFRQGKHDNWSTVVSRVAEELTRHQENAS